MNNPLSRELREAGYSEKDIELITSMDSAQRLEERPSRPVGRPIKHVNVRTATFRLRIPQEPIDLWAVMWDAVENGPFESRTELVNVAVNTYLKHLVQMKGVAE